MGLYCNMSLDGKLFLLVSLMAACPSLVKEKYTMDRVRFTLDSMYVVPSLFLFSPLSGGEVDDYYYYIYLGITASPGRRGKGRFCV